MRILAALILTTASLFAAPPAESEVRAWIETLADSDAARRDEAQRSLEALSTDWKPLLKEALASATDPEARSRIESVLAHIGRPRWETDFAAALARAKREKKPLLVVATPGAPDGFS